ncbi:V/A-type H+-transporting ATPase subunit I [Methanomicrobium sp. W14]|uniref:V-type ATP synthase subunit I n=1 Tax=Methanomicrobium sp. W14 TaxID=2817839 RepID=UPI001AE6044C|nr:V-type ATP synthase subunit I [Methanomicrobium sp. W14]MBP2133590.1 V/A-type H+-transporting ATPase subunit I [Methanomicrobium sp. W14]
MFKVQRMSKLLIAASKDQLDPIVRELYRHNVFHIEDFVEQNAEGFDGLKIGKPMENAPETSTELLRVRSLSNTMGIKADSVEKEALQSAGSLHKSIGEELPAIEKEVAALVSKRNELESKARECEQKIQELSPFTSFPYDLSLLSGYDDFSVVAGHIPHDVKLPVDCEEFFAENSEGNLYIAVFKKSGQKEVEDFLSGNGFQSLPIPKECGDALGRINSYTHEKNSLEKETGEINEQIAALKSKHASYLVACDELLTADVERAEAPLRFATTEQTFVAEGWVPTDKAKSLVKDLESVTGGKVFVTEEEIDYDKDSVPIEYDNPDFSKPSEVLMDIYSRPQYNEFDPTLLVAIVFPIFFGFILGDIAYGLILLIVSVWLRKYLKDSIAGNQLLDVLRNASIMSIIFGVIFSEFLGFACPWEPFFISRHFHIGATEATGGGPDAIILLIISAWIGILHITLGRSIHIRNTCIQMHPGKHRSKVIFAQLGWIMVMWGILFLIWTIAAIPLMPDLTAGPMVTGFNVFAFIGALLIVAGIIGIGLDSALELMELTTIISHVLSYTRLAAVGLSSVAIAAVVNFISIGMMIEPAFADFGLMSFVMIIAGIFVFLIGHILNTALGLLSGGLHSIRLHYVEFFTKFYQGGGKKYEPFGIIRKFTEE